MSNELLNALENRVTTAVDTIEDLRTEIRVLKEERQTLEAKLRELLSKIERIDGSNGSEAPAQADSPSEQASAGNESQGSGLGHMGNHYGGSDF